MVLPVWVALHMAAAYASETRLFMVPISLVLIPAALYRLPHQEIREKRVPVSGALSET
jgi:hypothetical protein